VWDAKGSIFARTHRREGRRASVIRVISTALFLLRRRIGQAGSNEPPRLQLTSLPGYSSPATAQSCSRGGSCAGLLPGCWATPRSRGEIRNSGHREACGQTCKWRLSELGWGAARHKVPLQPPRSMQHGTRREWRRTPTTSHPEQRGCRASPRCRRARRACAAPGSATSRKRWSHYFPCGPRATRRAEQAPPPRRAGGRGFPCTAVAVLHEPCGGRTGARPPPPLVLSGHAASLTPY